MKRIEYFELLSGLFDFKTVYDEMGNELVLFSQNKNVAVGNIGDKTEFEAMENHVHLLDNVRKDEFDRLIPVSEKLGKALLNGLKSEYPQKHFIVYVSIHLHDSMIIRFHQKWNGEEPYCNPSEFTSDREKVLSFEA